LRIDPSGGWNDARPPTRAVMNGDVNANRTSPLWTVTPFRRPKGMRFGPASGAVPRWRC
jgi:hypothetical protein